MTMESDPIAAQSENTVLVCVSPAPASSRVISVAAQTAKSKQAGLVALHVNTRGELGVSAVDRDRLRENFALVTRLGGMVETVQGRNVAKEIIAFAERHGITDIYVGKNATRRWAGIIAPRPDTVTSIVREGRYLDVHVIPGRPDDYRTDHRPKQPVGHTDRKRPRRAIAAALLASLILTAALAIGLLFHQAGFTEANIVMVFILAVLIISALEGRIVGLGASVAAVALFNLLFTEPRLRLVVDDSQYVITFVVMLAVAFIASELTARIRREAEIARVRERHTEMLYRTTRSLLHVRTDAALAAVGVEHLGRMLRRDAACFLPGPHGSWLCVDGSGRREAAELIDDHEERTLKWCYGQSKPGGWTTSASSGAKRYYHPLIIQGTTLGFVGVSKTDAELDHGEHSLIEVVGAQLAMALDRERLARAEEESRIAAERERLRGNLLRSISHDFRTPLAAIIGAATTLLSGDDTDRKTESDLIAGIRDDAAWLASLVENLLSLTRLEAEDLHLQTEWEVIDDLILSAVERCRKRTASDRIHVDLPESTSLICIDAGLIEQVLVNLIDNAVRHTPPSAQIYVTAKVVESQAVFEVRDEGPGLSDDALQHAFDRFYTDASVPDSRRGLGLGLAICRSIVDAHGGTIEAENADHGGAVFRFRLPNAGQSSSHLDDDSEWDPPSCRTNL